MLRSLVDMVHYDIAVIGGGSGNKITGPASKMGLRIACCEKGPMGGTCLNRGCIPSKMLIHAADVAETIQTSHRFNVSGEFGGVDFQALVNHVCTTIDGDAESTAQKYEENPNIDLYRQPAHFIGPKMIQCGETVFTADKIFVVAGCRPHIPNIPGLSDTPFMTSTEALRLKELPRRLAVIGAGYIACELGHYFASLGSELHMFARSTLIRFEDSEVAAEFQKVFSSKHNVHVGVVPKSVQYDNEKKEFFLLYDEGGQECELVVDNLLVCTGVVPNTDSLNLAAAGIEINDQGYIIVDEYLRTSAENVWAYGDIVGNFLFRHSANFEGEYLMENVVLPESPILEPINYVGMPHAIFSSPQVAGVGETEDQLISRGADYVKGVNAFASSAMGMALRSDHGFVKLLIERGTRKILGCHIVGEQASVLIHQIIPLMRLGGRLDDLLLMIHIHPALSEIVRNAARKARDALISFGEELPVSLRLK